jgi:predicted GIY-YIG superfamily endonuclease
LGKTPSAARTRKRKRPRRHHHSVYVVELSRGVLYERKFQRCNPLYNPDKPCVYVGMTGLDPDVRFDKHKAGIQSNSYVRKYGVRLLPALYQAYNPMPYDAARDMEVELAIYLREQGYGVWQG